jgi:hypothetical protein
MCRVLVLSACLLMPKLGHTAIRQWLDKQGNSHPPGDKSISLKGKH